MEEILWPFPFVGMALLVFLISAISECCTRGKSGFYETFTSLLSIPEVLCWACYTMFLIYRIGLIAQSAMACLACGIYIVLNIVFACVHPRKIVKNSLKSY
jgi:hypothetical protein